MQHQRRIVSLAALAGLPGSIVALALLWMNDYPARIQWGLSLVIAVVWIGAAIATERQVVSPLHAISNLLKALREHDYSVRGKVESHDAVGVVVEEINDLAHTLRSQRIDVLEAGKLLNKIMDEIDVAILSFDLDDKLRLINRAGERLLDGTAKTLLGRTAGELGLAECLYGRTPRLMEFGLAGGGGRWEVRRTTFRQGGVPQQLLVLSDLSRALREEERRAWQRIVRVLGHELNNSLTPISSISESLTGLLSRRSRPNDWEQDLTRGLSVISSRSESLTQFVESYSKLARLPEPTLEPCTIAPLVRRIVQLETRLGVEILPGPDITIMVDVSQIEQLLINLIRNAVDAATRDRGRCPHRLEEPADAVGTVKTAGRGWPARPIFLCPSSPPNREGRVSDSSCAGKSPRRTMARSFSGTAFPDPDARPVSGCRDIRTQRRPAHPPLPRTPHPEGPFTCGSFKDGSINDPFFRDSVSEL